jgi:hypothetical protein
MDIFTKLVKKNYTATYGIRIEKKQKKNRQVMKKFCIAGHCTHLPLPTTTQTQSKGNRVQSPTLQPKFKP